MVMEHFNGILYYKYGPANKQHTNQLTIASYTFVPRYTGDKGKPVTHFQFLHHFGGPKFRFMCNCRYETVSRMSVSVVLCYI